jgi:hypothetical protein
MKNKKICMIFTLVFVFVAISASSFALTVRYNQNGSYSADMVTAYTTTSSKADYIYTKLKLTNSARTKYNSSSNSEYNTAYVSTSCHSKDGNLSGDFGASYHLVKDSSGNWSKSKGVYY